MKRSQIVITLLLLALVLVVAFASGFSNSFGALPPAGWLAVAVFAGLAGLGLVFADTLRGRRRVLEAMAEFEMLPAEQKKTLVMVDSLGAALDPDGLLNPGKFLG